MTDESRRVPPILRCFLKTPNESLQEKHPRQAYVQYAASEAIRLRRALSLWRLKIARKRRTMTTSIDEDIDAKIAQGKCVVGPCHARIRTGMLMCATHWRRVPTLERRRVIVSLMRWRNGTGTLEALRDAQKKAAEAAQ